MNLNCKRCAHVYALDGERDVINIYATDTAHNHIVTKCPACGTTMRLFCSTSQLQDAINAVDDLRVVIHNTQAPSAIRALAREANGGTVGKKKDKPEPQEPEEEVVIPREMLIELLDTIRHFDHACDGSCNA